ncbi:hypothetical protein AWC38_SpisGene15695 [Stylophora pistillata]|uniref:PNPLA domain-containing protein n=1 Tax=Stylophora pistillata TaxID=50429 RepID=A0A2B4RN55_STYPI|nr:hypothetical protein AWC38_SpisGene15695 [Stylophora pistillata]
MASTKTGLAFSGGGIRSAALCSGVLRRLLQNKAKVDYLSCVSGGGYTGTAFLDWKYRKEKKAKGNEEWHEEFFDNMRQRAGYLCNWEKPCQGILDTIAMFLLVLTVTFIEPIVIYGSFAFPLAFIIDYLFGEALRVEDCNHIAAPTSPINQKPRTREIQEHCLSGQGTVAFIKITLFSVLVVLFVIFLHSVAKISRERLVHVFNRWRLHKAFYSKESLGTKGWRGILHNIFCPLWTCLKKKQKQEPCPIDQRGVFDTPANDVEPAHKRSLNLADLRGMEPEYISNMTVHCWKEDATSDKDGDLLTMSPTTIERLDRDPSTVDPFKDKLSPRDIELSDAMATSAAAISSYEDNLKVLRLSTLLGLEMEQLLPILINILRGLPLIAVPAVYFSKGDEESRDEWSIKAGVFTFFAIHLVLAFIGALADRGAQTQNVWKKIARWFTLHDSFVKFVTKGLSIINNGPTPPPVMLLSDGGHVENLGILPLLKKQLKKIIVVDGGYCSNEKKYGESLLESLMLARRELSCSFIGHGGRDVTSDLLENFVKLQQPNERKPRHFE